MPDASTDAGRLAGDAVPAGGPRAIGPGLLSALTFGLATPATKAVFEDAPDLFQGGWLYFTSGVGLAAVVALRRRRASPEATARRLRRGDLGWLAGGIAAGGLVAPYAYARGIGENPAFLASLLLNAEVVFTAAIAALFFGERVTGLRRVGIGLVALGGAACSALGMREAGAATLAGCLWTTLACLGWALDNNLTNRIATKDPVSIAMWKGLVGGGAALALAAMTANGPGRWEPRMLLLGALVGMVGFGLSLVLFIRSLRVLGAARTGAVFGTAPFLGALASAVFLHESVSPWLAGAGLVMAVGVGLATVEPRER